MVAISLFAAVVGAAAGLLDAQLSPSAPGGPGAVTTLLVHTGAGGVARVEATATAVTGRILFGAPFPPVPSGPIACATASRCVAAATIGTSPAALLTTDDGARWTATVLRAADGFVATAAACASSSTCFLAGTSARGAILYESSDGGRQYSRAALPGGFDSITALACDPGGHCLAGGAGRAGAAGSAELAARSPGGRWHLLARPSQVSQIGALACPAVGRCVLGGDRLASGPTGAGGASPVLLDSSDGGRSWQVASVPSVSGALEVDALSCPVAARCLAAEPTTVGGSPAAPVLLASTDAGRRWSGLPSLAGRLPGAAPDAVELACDRAFDCLLATGTAPVLASADGGRSWTVTSLRTSTGLARPIARGLACSPAGAGSGCTAAWYSILPDRAGMAAVPAAALTSAGVPGTAWHVGRLPGGLPALEIGCATAALCTVASTGTGLVETVAVPSGRLRTLTARGAPGGDNAVERALWCSEDLCGAQVTEESRDGDLTWFVGAATAGGPVISVASPPAASLGSELACASLETCVASRPAGRRAVVELSTPGATSWRAVTLPAAAGAADLSGLAACATATRCLAVSSGTGGAPVLSTGDAAGGFRRLGLDGRLAVGDRAESVACDEQLHCAVEVAGEGTTAVVVTGPGSPAVVSTFATSAVDLLAPPRCVEGECYAPASVDGEGGVLATADGGRRWSFATVVPAHRTGAADRQAVAAFEPARSAALSCATPTTCVAVVPAANGEEAEEISLR